MAVPVKHVLRQGENLGVMARAARAALFPRTRGGGPLETPTPLVVRTQAPPPADLVADYVRHVGGTPSAWRGRVPHHLFPQWAFPLMSETLTQVPYDVSKLLNGGCTITANAPLPADRPWRLTACLSEVDDDERRAIFTQRITTGPEDEPEALVAEVRVILPKHSKGPKGPKPPPQVVPVDAHELAWWRLPATAGRDFAVLTGDFNPIHWIPPAARAAGFKRCILHGFSTLARSIEGLRAARFQGDPDAFSQVDARFARPVLLPGEVGLYVDDATRSFWVGAAHGAPAALLGSFVPRGA
ncbi:MAG: hypothetical protein H6732_04130 [Alphaproteobacteria bacterium]|nr:hypothetical protein [Alphaproteobacteria bacterium]